MSIKKTLIMLIIAAIAVGVFMFDKRRTDEKNAVKEAEARLVAPKKEEISEITVHQGGKTTQLVKQGEDWEITQPIKTRADNSSVGTIVDEIDRARRADAFEPEAGKKMEEFGLDKPELKVEVKAASNYIAEIELGAKTTGGNEVYAKAAKDPKIFTVNDTLVTQLSRPVNELRYKNALPAPLDDPTSAVLSYDGKTVSLEKKGGEWKMLSPIKGPADNDKIGEIMGNIGRITAVDFIDTAPLNLAKMGLDKPVVNGTFTALVKEKPKTMTLMVGNEVTSKEGQFYAMNQGANYAFMITRDDLDKLKPALDDLRSKKLFNISATDAGRVIFDMRGQTVDLKADTAGKWSYATDPSVRLDQSAVNSTLSELINLKATKFIDTPTTPGQTGLDNPFLRLTVASKDGKTTETILTGHTAPNDEFVYAKPEKGDTLMGIPADAPKKFFVTRDQFLYKKLFEIDETLVKKVQIRDGERKLTLTQTPGGAWSAKPEGGGKEIQVEGPKVSALIFSVSSLDWAKRYTPGVPVDEAVIKEQKMDQPTREIVLMDEAGKELGRLGQAGDKDDMTFVRKGQNEFYGINKMNYNSVASSLDSLLEETKAPAAPAAPAAKK